MGTGWPGSDLEEFEYGRSNVIHEYLRFGFLKGAQYTGNDLWLFGTTDPIS